MQVSQTFLIFSSCSFLSYFFKNVDIVCSPSSNMKKSVSCKCTSLHFTSLFICALFFASKLFGFPLFAALVFFPSGLTGPRRRSGPRSGTALAHTGGPLPPALSPATTTWAKGPALLGGARVVLPQPGGARGAPTRATRWGVR